MIGLCPAAEDVVFKRGGLQSRIGDAGQSVERIVGVDGIDGPTIVHGQTVAVTVIGVGQGAGRLTR